MNRIMAVTIWLSVGTEISIEAAMALVNHKHTKDMTTRSDVTSSWYRRWRKIARILSTVMTAIVRNDAHPRRKKVK